MANQKKRGRPRKEDTSGKTVGLDLEHCDDESAKTWKVGQVVGMSSKDEGQVLHQLRRSQRKSK